MHVAFYGSLMQGKPPHFGAQANIPIQGKMEYLGPCTLAGFLYDLGEFPGLVETHIEREPKPVVQAELYEILDADALAILDAYEGFFPEAPEASFYLREWIPLEHQANTKSGTEPINAWCYFYNESIEGKQLIKSGCWRTHVMNKNDKP